MKKRVLVVADEQVKPAAERYVRHFIADRAGPPDMAPEVHWARAQCYRCFGLAQEPRGGTGGFDLGRYTGVYYWGLYDHILLQDIFLKGSGAHEHLSSLPLAVAYHLVYRRGQFQAPRPRTVRPIVLDPRLLEANGLAARPLDERKARLLLAGPLQRVRTRLCHAIDSAGFWGDLLPAGHEEQAETIDVQPVLPSRAFDEIASLMCGTVANGSLRVVMVDDNPEWLEIPYKALGGDRFEEITRDKRAGFWVLRCGKGVLPSPALEWIETFEDLCMAVVARGPYDGGLSVVVTDVLFGRGSDKNGLDLLRQVRRADLASSPRNVVIAFTGYGSPLITAACHGVGADFVVQKSSGDAHGYAADGKPSSPQAAPIIEMFWNILWLRAASWFTSERLAQLRHELLTNPSPAMTAGEAKRILDQVVKDIEAVFPPHEWLQCFRRLRQRVSELLFELGDFVNFWFTAQGSETRELRPWRNRLSGDLDEIGTRLLGSGREIPVRHEE
jgi:hypothetical protein